MQTTTAAAPKQAIETFGLLGGGNSFFFKFLPPKIGEVMLSIGSTTN